MAALRLVSEGRDDRVEISNLEPSATPGDDCELTRSLGSIALPSREVLLTLLWALNVEERRLRQKQVAVLDPERSASADQSTVTTDYIILKVAGVKRVRSRRLDHGGSKRPRMSE